MHVIADNKIDTSQQQQFAVSVNEHSGMISTDSLARMHARSHAPLLTNMD
jgi:hypothetical protein